VERALADARSPEIVSAYLSRRGLSVTSPVLRGDARAPYFDDNRKLIGRYPAVVSPITGPDGSLHRLQGRSPADRRQTIRAPHEQTNQHMRAWSASSKPLARPGRARMRPYSNRT
jgi:hypothetical protein